MINLLNQIQRLFDTDTPFVLATICSIDGTSPESAGAQLVITANGTSGKLHSARRQQIIVKQSRELLCSEDEWIEKTYPLGTVMGTENGHYTVIYNKFVAHEAPDWITRLSRASRNGRAAVLANHINRVDGNTISSFEVYESHDIGTDDDGAAGDSFLAAKVNELLTQHNPQPAISQIICNSDRKTYLQRIMAPDLPVAVVGHSQVALSLIDQLLLLPVQIHWLSDRFATGDPRALKLARIDLTDAALQSLPDRTRVAIATGNHELDLRCCELALKNRKLSYIGCLGSLKKATITRSRLADLGVPESRINDLKMPIGLDSITGKQPAIIAASIVAQLLADPGV